MSDRKGSTKMLVTRVFDGHRTLQEAFVKVILNAENEDGGLKMSGGRDIIKDKSTCGGASPQKGEENG